MWREQVAQGFLIGKRTEAPRYCVQKLGTLSLIGAAMIVVSFSAKQAIAQGTAVEALILPTLVTNPSEERSHPTPSRLMAQLPTLPPTIFPTNQSPTVSVPPLQSTPAQTPTPDITFQAPTHLPASVSPTLTLPVVEFGQPLPKTAQQSPRRTLQRTIPTLEPAASD